MKTEINKKSNRLAVLRRALTLLRCNEIEVSEKASEIVSAKQTEILGLCWNEINQPTNANEFIAAIAKLSRVEKTYLQKIAEEKIASKQEVKDDLVIN